TVTYGLRVAMSDAVNNGRVFGPIPAPVAIRFSDSRAPNTRRGLAPRIRSALTVARAAAPTFGRFRRPAGSAARKWNNARAANCRSAGWVERTRRRGVSSAGLGGG